MKSLLENELLSLVGFLTILECKKDGDLAPFEIKFTNYVIKLHKLLIGILIIFIVIVPFGLSGQGISCGNEGLHERLMNNDSNYKDRFLKYMEEIKKVKVNSKYNANAKTDYTIPVVVHLIYAGETDPIRNKISDEKIRIAIEDELNNSFDGTGIQFCLAKRNNDGNTTNGINRVNGKDIISTYNGKLYKDVDGSGVCSNISDRVIKNATKWPEKDYFNIWIVEDICGKNDIYGYGIFPWDSETRLHGIVLDVDSFNNPSSKFSTYLLAHEVGHYLGLLHTFNGEDALPPLIQCPLDLDCNRMGDRICDTPPHKSTDCGSNNPCTSNGNWNNSRYNYMNYCDDIERNLRLFTAEQIENLKYYIATNPRKTLLSSNGCSPPDLADLTISNASVSPTSVEPGANVVLLYKVNNIGSADAPANYTSFHLSSNTVLTPGQNGDTYLDENFNSQTIGANSSTNILSKSVKIPANTPPGTYYIFISADGAGNVQELNEDNNQVFVPITVSGGTCTPPTNDNCSSSVPTITSNGSCLNGSVECANGSYGPNQCSGCNCTSPDDKDVYYKFTAQATSHTVALSKYASNFDGVIELRTACAFGTAIGCYDPPGTPTTVSNTWNNLSIGQTYYIRIFEHNNTGSPPSSPMFTVCVTHTGGCTNPSTPTASATTNPTQTGFRANWNSSSGATSYYLDVATNSSFSNILSGYNNLNVGNVTSHNVTGLGCNTTYYYRIRAGNSCGTSSNSGTITANTSACTCNTPSTPSAISANNTTQTGFSARWNSSSGATAYYLDVATNSSFSNILSGYNNLNVGNVTSHNVTGLSCNTTYYYRVRAGNSCGTSSSSGSIAASTSTCTSSCPPANDNCTSSVPTITSNGSCVNGTVACATGSYGANQCSGCNCTSPDDKDVYYKFTAQATSQTVTLSNYASNFDGVIELRTACALNTAIGCYDPSGVPSTVSNTWNNLTIGQTYYIRIFEYNNTGTPPSSPTFTVCVTHSGGCTSPSPPTASAATNPTQTGFRANWNSSSGATSYSLDVSTNSSFTSFVSGFNNLNVGNTTNYTLSGLNCNTTYYYRVRASNSCGSSSNSGIIERQTSACTCNTPLTPTASAATNPTQTGFRANWNSSPNATTYYLDVSSNSSFTNILSGYDKLNVGSVTIYNVTGLNCGTTYYYRISAGNSCGTSSNSSSITTQTSTCTSNQPSNDGCLGSFSAINLTPGTTCNYTSGISTGATNSGFPSCEGEADDDVFFSFIANSTTMTVQVQSGVNYDAVFQLLSGPCGSNMQEISPGCIDNSSTRGLESQAYNGLTVGATYFIRVWHFYQGSGSGDFQICAFSSGCTTPSSPTASSASNLSQTGFRANWSSSPNATTYYLDVSSNSTFTNILSGYDKLNVGSVTNYNVIGLNCGTTYYYRVRAGNSCGNSSNSSTINAQTSTCSQTCTPPGNQASEIVFSNVTSNSMTVNWTNGNGYARLLVAKAGSPINGLPVNGTSYTDNSVFGSGSTIAQGEYVVFKGPESGPVTITNLSPGTTYYFRVFEANCSSAERVYNFNTASNNPNSQATLSNCTIPIGTNQSGVTQTFATLSWNNVSGTQSYSYRYRVSGTSSWTTLNTTSITVNLSNLTCGTNYEWQVRAECSSANSSYSSLRSFSTSTCPATCDIPTGTNQSGVTQTSATLSWNNVSGAQNYSYRYRVSGTSSWTTLNTTSISVNLSTLTCGTTYEWQVRAECSSANSSYSSSRSFSTSTCPATCDIPTGTNQYGVTQTSATLSWNNVSGAQNYSYRYRVSGTSSWTTLNTTSISVNLTNLTCGTTYEWQVRAECLGANSSYTESRTLLTSSCSISCSTPTISIIPPIVSQTSAKLSWGSVTSATDYFLRYREKGNSSWTTLSTSFWGTIYTSYTLSNLKCGTEYEWQVSASCSGVNSIYSSTNTFNTYECFTPSEPCSSITKINGCGSSSLQTFKGKTIGLWNSTACWFYTGGSESIYSFTAPTTGIYSIQIASVENDAYVYYSWKSGNCSESDWNCIGTFWNTGQYGQMSWTAGNTYYVLLDNESTFEGTHTFFINCPTICNIPTTLSESSISNTSANLSWGNVSSSNNYSYRYRVNGTSTWTTLTTTSTTPFITGLSCATQYEWQVRSQCSNNNNSEYSPSKIFTTTACTVPCLPPPSNSLTIGSPANDLNLFTVFFGWFPVDNADAYIYEFSSNGIDNWNVFQESYINLANFNFLTPNRQGYFRIKSRCGNQYSDYASGNPYPIYSACSNPDAPFILSSSSNEINFNLPIESTNSNPSYTTYAVYCPTLNQYVQQDGKLGNTPVYQTKIQWGLFINIVGLNPGTDYCFYFMAKNMQDDIRFDSNNKTCVTTDIATSIGNLESLSGFSIFPNPNSGLFRIVSDNKITDVVEVHIFNNLGHRVYVNLIQPTDSKMDLEINLKSNGLASGVYFLQLNMDNKSTVKKIVIEYD